MDIKLLLTVFTTVFVAELGDKTQLATLLFAAEGSTSKVTVFIAASMALIAASGLAVVAGTMISQHLSERVLSYAAGVLFIVIGGWTILRA